MEDHDSTSQAHSGECCDICGDIGVSCAIVTCPHCKVSCEHLYCMRICQVDCPKYWYCDDCKRRNEKVSPASGRKEDLAEESGASVSRKLHYGSTQPNRLPYGPRQNCMDRERKILSGKTKPLSAEEVIRLSSGAKSCISPVKLTFHPSSVSRKNAAIVYNKTPVKSRAIPAKSSLQQVRANPALAPEPSRHFKPVRPANSQMNVVAQQQVTPSIKGLREKNINEVPLKDHTLKEKNAIQAPLKDHLQQGEIHIQAPLKDHTQKEKYIIHAPLKAHAQKEQSRDAFWDTTEIRLEKAICETGSASSPFTHGQQIVSSGGSAFHDTELQRTELMTAKATSTAYSSVNCLADPSLYSSWKGSFKVFNSSKQAEISDEIQAYPPFRVLRKVYDFSKLMPEVLQFELVPRWDIWVDLFRKLCLDKRDVGLYFFPRNRERRENYTLLLEIMGAKDLAMRTRIDGVELLIFTSKLLNSDCQKFEGRHFLWGVLKKRAKYASLFDAAHEHHTELDGNDIDMEIDMIGGECVGRLDIVVSKESLHLPPPNVTTELCNDIPPGFEKTRSLTIQQYCSSMNSIGHGSAIKTERLHEEERYPIVKGQTASTSIPKGNSSENFPKPIASQRLEDSCCLLYHPLNVKHE